MAANKKILTVLLAVVTISTTTMQAQNDKKDFVAFNHLDLGVTIGSTGLGIDIASPFGNYVQVRTGFEIMPRFEMGMNFDIQSFDESGNVSYYMDGKFMGSHQFEMLKKLAGSKTLTFDINPYGWYTGQHHYMDDLKLTLPTSTISDNFNDGVLDSKIWQTPTNPSGVREDGGILKTEQVRTDWPFHLRTKALPLDIGGKY